MPRQARSMPSWAPRTIGRFEILSVLGSGGFAVVYLAFDPRLNRNVALKIPRPHALVRAELRRRFVTEVRATARLDHPHIVPVFEAGEDGDLPYLVCALCDGHTLAEWYTARNTPLLPTLAAKIIRQLANAVEYSHSQGILHRDIKPANVLLFRDSANADEQFPFVPRLGDFGLAKLRESGSMESSTSQVVGTPSYMAPEVLNGTGDSSAVSADIYALGAVLYYLIIGRPPFGSATPIETLRQITEYDPLAPHLISPGIGQDLSLICLRCLEKEPTRRYASAALLAADLDRYLNGRPVLARRTSWPVRCQKWFRRRPLVGSLVVLSAALAVLLLFTAVRYQQSRTFLLGQLQQKNAELVGRVRELDASVQIAHQATHAAQENQHNADRLIFAGDLQLAGRAWTDRNPRDAVAVLSRHVSPAADDSERASPHGNFALNYLWNRVTSPSVFSFQTQKSVWWLQPSPDQEHLAVCGSDGRLELHSTHAGYPKTRTSAVPADELCCVAFSDDGLLMATGGAGGSVFVISTSSGELLREVRAIPGMAVFGIRFLPDSHSALIAGRSPDVFVWNLDSGLHETTLHTGHTRVIEYISLSPDRQTLATAGSDGRITRLSLNRPDERGVIDASGEPIMAVQFSTDGSRLISVGSDGWLHVWNAESLSRERSYQSLEDLHSLVVTRNNDLIFGDAAGVITLLKLPPDDSHISDEEWHPERVWMGHSGPVSAMSVVQAGTTAVVADDRLLTAGRDGVVRLWQLHDDIQLVQIAADAAFDWGLRQGLATTTGGQFCMAGPKGLAIREADSPQQCRMLLPDHPLTACAHAAQTDQFVVGDSHGRVAVLSDEDSAPNWIGVFDNTPVTALAIDSKARWAAAGNTDFDLAVINLSDGKVVARKSRAYSFCMSGNAKWLVTGRIGTNDLEVFDVASMSFCCLLPGHRNTITGLCFNPAGTRLMSVSNDRSVQIRSAETWTLQHTLNGHLGEVRALTVSRNGDTLATGDSRGRVKLWDLDSGRELLELEHKIPQLASMCFTADGRSLIALDGPATIHIFRSGALDE